MLRKRCIPIHLLLACFFTLIQSACKVDPKTSLSGARPNIIFILADDMGWADLPVYGNLFNEAPNLTRMAEEGIRFTDAYAACPVCSPTRASIMSGQYPARVGITDFITGHWRPYEELIVPSNRTQYLPEEIITMGEIMKDAGYATGYFGKWHLGFEDRHQPGNQGFETVNVYKGGGFFSYASRMSTPIQVEPGTPLSEALTDLSLDFIRDHQENPFFLYLAHYDVHVQLDADSILIEKYLDKEKVEGYPCNAVYAAMVEHVDNSLGRIFRELEELELVESTLVIFFSDNGGLISRFDQIPLLAKERQHIYEGDTLLYVASSNAPLRAEKGTVYEGGIREPFIAWWPGQLEAGKVNSSLISSVDFLPTFAELAGVVLPDEQVFDGISLVGLLEGAEPDPDRAIFWHYPVYHHDEPASAIRKGKWKLIHNLVNDQRYLYNLENDIGETTDLSQSEQEITNELYDILEAWRDDCEAEFPVPNPGFIPEGRYEWGRHPDRN
ncbi:MAG: arylsulfatase [Bacteroidetes bacterium]|nr:MAG: arylsulfatase [Bacteroidota bacterium]RLD94179.1 MAG: arylsulfatase [Bacteroidota bacterium]